MSYLLVDVAGLTQVVGTLHQFTRAAVDAGHVVPVHLVGVKEHAVCLGKTDKNEALIPQLCLIFF